VSPTLLARGHDLTARLRAVEADLEAWMGELPASNTETVVAKMHGSHVLTMLQQARVEIGEFTQIAAGVG